MPICALCGRDVPHLTEHHLVPRSRGKKGQVLPTVMLCPPCHKQLHALFTNEQLARDFDTLAKLRENEAVRKFVKWIRGQHPATGVRVRR